MSAIETVLDFLDRINKRDADKLAELMTADHVFIDSLGNTMQGREKMRVGWRGYYSFCPDHWVTIRRYWEMGNMVAMFGLAGGTVAANGKLPLLFQSLPRTIAPNGEGRPASAATKTSRVFSLVHRKLPTRSQARP